MNIKGLVKAKVERFFEEAAFGLVKMEDVKEAEVPLMSVEEFIEWAASVLVGEQNRDHEMVALDLGERGKVPGHAHALLFTK